SAAAITRISPASRFAQARIWSFGAIRDVLSTVWMVLALAVSEAATVLPVPLLWSTKLFQSVIALATDGVISRQVIRRSAFGSRVGAGVVVGRVVVGVGLGVALVLTVTDGSISPCARTVVAQPAAPTPPRASSTATPAAGTVTERGARIRVGLPIPRPLAVAAPSPVWQVRPPGTRRARPRHMSVPARAARRPRY